MIWGTVASLLAVLSSGQGGGGASLKFPLSLNCEADSGPSHVGQPMPLERVRLGIQQLGVGGLKGLGTPVSRLAVPSPGEEIGADGKTQVPRGGWGPSSHW